MPLCLGLVLTIASLALDHSNTDAASRHALRTWLAEHDVDDKRVDLLMGHDRPEGHERRGESGAGNETRTRDLNLGKVPLYQLSYSRIVSCRGEL